MDYAEAAIIELNFEFIGEGMALKIKEQA